MLLPRLHLNPDCLSRTLQRSCDPEFEDRDRARPE